MSEQFKGTVEPTLENLEKNGGYEKYQSAMEEEERIMSEIKKVFATTTDQKEAEKIVIEILAPQMDRAMKASKEALAHWLNEMQK